jgi:hypothetical protein
MKILCLVALAGVLVACSPIAGENQRGAERIAEMNLCPEERPQVCTMEYRPTCGHLDNGRRKDYASHCSACSDQEVVGTFEGSCDSQ